MGWNDAADLAIKGVEGATKIKCFEFGANMAANM
jgi:hypothetical protein